jgi:hypothetical protein
MRCNTVRLETLMAGMQKIQATQDMMLFTGEAVPNTSKAVQAIEMLGIAHPTTKCNT